jgi:flavodoxin
VEGKDMEKKSLLIVYSYHHKNTLKVAKAIAKILDAEVNRIA